MKCRIAVVFNARDSLSGYGYCVLAICTPAHEKASGHLTLSFRKVYLYSLWALCPHHAPTGNPLSVIGPAGCDRKSSIVLPCEAAARLL